MKIINYQVKLRKIFYTVRTNRGNVLGSHVLKRKVSWKHAENYKNTPVKLIKKESNSKGVVIYERNTWSLIIVFLVALILTG